MRAHDAIPNRRLRTGYEQANLTLEQVAQLVADHVERQPAFANLHVVAVRHPSQRHHTFEVRGPHLHAVAKLYRGLDVAAVRTVSAGEHLVRQAGIPVPRELFRCGEYPLVVHEYVEGEHRTDPSPSLIAASAGMFVRAVVALNGFDPGWAPTRPAALPRRAREAEAVTADTRLLREIHEGWERLHELAVATPAHTCHSDWRADNVLYHDEEIVSALDWESLVRIPACEAMGYAAVSVTHSWRDEIYRPVQTEPPLLFLGAAERQWTAAGGAWYARQAQAAALYSAVLRLAEDRARGCEAVSLAGLSGALRG